MSFAGAWNASLAFEQAERRIAAACHDMRWPRLFGQFSRFDKWNLYRGEAAKRIGGKACAQTGKLDPASLSLAGAETARKVLDNAQPSNQVLAADLATSAGKPI